MKQLHAVVQLSVKPGLRVSQGYTSEFTTEVLQMKRPGWALEPEVCLGLSGGTIEWKYCDGFKDNTGKYK